MGRRLIRVLHCPADVGGHPSGLVAAECTLGLDSRLLLVDGTGPRRELRRYTILAHALRHADVVHFNFGSSLLPRWYPAELSPGLLRRVYARYARLLELRDLPLLCRAGKRIFVTYQGDDVRQADDAPHASNVTYFHPQLDARKREAAAQFDRYADGIYALNPDLLSVLPARASFLPYASVDPATWQPVQPAATGALRVAHAPSDRAVKGTTHVVTAVERLRGEGVAIELDLVEGVPRDAVKERFATADVVVDQLIVGWYGGVSVEAMALGKPVVAHLRQRELARIPHEMRDELPIMDATPETVEGVLRDLAVARRGEVPALGRRSRAYVERWHDPRAIAAYVKSDYERALRGDQRRS